MDGAAVDEEAGAGVVGHGLDIDVDGSPSIADRIEALRRAAGVQWPEPEKTKIDTSIEEFLSDD